MSKSDKPAKGKVKKAKITLPVKVEINGAGEAMPKTALFKFGLRQIVRIIESSETGTVHARSESTMSEPQYLLRYRSADGGKAVEAWWSENALDQFAP